MLYLTNADPNSLINDEEAQRICAENAQKELASKLVINIERIQDTKCEEGQLTKHWTSNVLCQSKYIYMVYRILG